MARSRKNPMASFRSPALSPAGESLPRAKPRRSSREFQTDPLLKKQSRGFTLIELMIHISVILILVSVALPAYNQSIWRARESVLKQNLFALRSVISQYTLDKQKAPQSLQDLVSGGYFKQIPNDPMTDRNDTWT